MISLLYPSRSRPTKAKQTFDSWVSNASTSLEVIISLDVDDPTLSQYTELFKGQNIIINKNRSLVDAVNVAAKQSTGDLIVVMSDDFCCFANWDLKILEAVDGKTDFVLKVFDGRERWIATLPVLDRAYYERYGFIYDSAFTHLYVDTFFSHLADCTGRMIIRNDIVFKHENPSYNRDVRNTDSLHRRNNQTQRSGEILYLEKLKHAYSFGLDIWKLSPEADINWFKQRIK